MNTSRPQLDLVLTGNIVELRPLSVADVPALCGFGLAPELWKWTPRRIQTEKDMENYVAEALECAQNGACVPLVMLDRDGDRIVGCTRFGNIVPEHKRLEIGWTWIDPAVQGSAVNSEVKLLMLEYAFDELRYNRVELKTDALNSRSRHAMLAIGCTEEGTLRRHVVNSTGRIRDTVYFSIIRDEWPGVRARLEERIARKTVGDKS